MTESFDPYLKWLGIRDKHRPFNHYRLLGLDLFESDADVIANAAERQIRHIQSYVDGPHAVDCRQILAELETARKCLIHVESRAAYDETLHSQGSQPQIQIQTRSPNENATGQIAKPLLRPKIKTVRPRRKKQNRAFFDFVGWVLGAVGALVFAYILLNTDLLDRIRGHDSQEIAKTSFDPTVNEPTESPKGKKSNPVPRKTTRINPHNKSNPRVEPDSTTKTVTETESVAENQPPMVLTEIQPANPAKSESPASTESRAGKRALPDANLIAAAQQEIKDLYNAQFKSKNANAKQMLATTLLNNSSNRSSQPEFQYAMLQLSAQVGSSVGELDTVISAFVKMDQEFEIDFWSSLTPRATAAMAKNADFETIAGGVERLLEMSREAKKFGLTHDFANQAANSARKQGDVLQQKMLSSFGRDMKALAGLGKTYSTVVKIEPEQLGAKEKLQIGKFLCFGNGDWEQGLTYLAEGNDRGMATVAKLELQNQDGGNDLTVANEWFKLRNKSKYKILDRRCMAERALSKYELATSSLTNVGLVVSEEMAQARMEIQIVKRFVHDPSQMAGRIFVFDVQGPANFDAAQLENGSRLRLGLGQRFKTLAVRNRAQAYLASTDDRKTNFKIRLMDNGLVEMRLYNASSGVLQNIMYGK